MLGTRPLEDEILIKKAHSLLHFLATAILVISVFVSATSAEGCFSIVVGKEASADGFVIMAHNEDDGPPQIANYHNFLQLLVIC